MSDKKKSGKPRRESVQLETEQSKVESKKPESPNEEQSENDIDNEGKNSTKETDKGIYTRLFEVIQIHLHSRAKKY